MLFGKCQDGKEKVLGQSGYVRRRQRSAAFPDKHRAILNGGGLSEQGLQSKNLASYLGVGCQLPLSETDLEISSSSNCVAGVQHSQQQWGLISVVGSSPVEKKDSNQLKQLHKLKLGEILRVCEKSKSLCCKRQSCTRVIPICLNEAVELCSLEHSHADIPALQLALCKAPQ